MNVIEAIEGRHAVRAYDGRNVDEWLVELLIRAASHAPSAMNTHPLVFAVVQDRERLKRWSDRAKTAMLACATSVVKVRPPMAQFADPAFNVFYDAGTLIVIGAREASAHAEADCWLAAQNLMLAAYEQGLGTCPIGSAIAVLSLPDVKKELAFPPSAVVVAPIIVGYPRASQVAPGDAEIEPKILSWY